MMMEFPRALADQVSRMDPQRGREIEVALGASLTYLKWGEQYLLNDKPENAKGCFLVANDELYKLHRRILKFQMRNRRLCTRAN